MHAIHVDGEWREYQVTGTKVVAGQAVVESGEKVDTALIYVIDADVPYEASDKVLLVITKEEWEALKTEIEKTVFKPVAKLHIVQAIPSQEQAPAKFRALGLVADASKDVPNP